MLQRGVSFSLLFLLLALSLGCGAGAPPTGPPPSNVMKPPDSFNMKMGKSPKR